MLSALQDMDTKSMDEELRLLRIEKCSSQRTKFFVNGTSFRISPDEIEKTFGLTAAEMNKMFLGYVVERKCSKTRCDEIFKYLREHEISIIPKEA